MQSVRVSCQRLTLWVILLFSFSSVAHVIVITCGHLLSFESWLLMTFFCSFSLIYSHPGLERWDSPSFSSVLSPFLAFALRFSYFFEIKKTSSLLAIRTGLHIVSNSLLNDLRWPWRTIGFEQIHSIASGMGVVSDGSCFLFVLRVRDNASKWIKQKKKESSRLE